MKAEGLENRVAKNTQAQKNGGREKTENLHLKDIMIKYKKKGAKIWRGQYRRKLGSYLGLFTLSFKKTARSWQEKDEG